MQRNKGFKRSRIRLALSRSVREHRTAVEDQDLVQLYVGTRVFPATVRYLHHALLEVEERIGSERKALRQLLLNRQIDSACDFLAGADGLEIDLFCELCGTDRLSVVEVASRRGFTAALNFVGSMASAGLGAVEDGFLILTPLGCDIHRWLTEFKPEEGG